ncbi:hypothetical protein IMG5_079020 [Ichthyophthirius multifiliis]|uniref:Transmembrane protein n=1 Tax=Ichthyophthirius multifiliis TaxID=5932 RepID=G0QQH4_ICHMU|nr:hypothetical protein IMG5_079020 [Ichthyophthirius multifiliis]EGR32532.1 hypothetical protein IMG5_079020 [Ichthyophthirius multifiliis]|eukprot:XP_004036518.1 hypothetical protein IMG5_079020 [Ichthyophthirius multifiliis]
MFILFWKNIFLQLICKNIVSFTYFYYYSCNVICVINSFVFYSFEFQINTFQHMVYIQRIWINFDREYSFQVYKFLKNRFQVYLFKISLFSQKVPQIRITIIQNRYILTVFHIFIKEYFNTFQYLRQSGGIINIFLSNSGQFCTKISQNRIQSRLYIGMKFIYYLPSLQIKYNYWKFDYFLDSQSLIFVTSTLEIYNKQIIEV